VFLRWARRIGFDIDHYPRWLALVQRALERPAVENALQREGLKSEEFKALATA